MGGGLADATIARRLALSHRTVQRRVRRMMELTRVEGRFAFGLRVGELGILGSKDGTERVDGDLS
ncbi:DNA-binding response regulator [Streptomyces sp. SID5785]|uniref:DNA-binding response regulator n=1 Tax=Streptomyces sp. SID5785 TaxID=2690309 RepID=UPI0013612ED8|nr:DNA-binding response regulator [Streptomyces sp. SID5785]MZD04526.1 DNA-binding response regulator [Streptomyces sp. SID5785]